MNLSDLLVKAKRYAEALQVIEPAAKFSQDSASLQAALGSVYLAMKQPENALPVLKKAVELDPSAEMLNNVAYRMAEENTLLDQATDWARTAVTRIEADSAATKLSELKVDDLDRMNGIANHWDTLGWVYFRTGELEKAERYLRAAWVLSQRATIGVHLGRLYEREHKRDQAAHLYELAAVAEGHASATDVADRYQRLTGKALGASATPGAVYGPRASVPVSPGEELLRARMFKLPSITTESATADFFVLLIPGSKAANVKFISGSTVLREAGKFVAAVPSVAEFPDDGPVKLVRRATVSCGDAGCDLVLLTPGMVHSLD